MSNGDLPFHKATINDSVILLAFCYEKFKKIEDTDDKGRTTLHYAAKNKAYYCLKYLLRGRPNPNK